MAGQALKPPFEYYGGKAHLGAKIAALLPRTSTTWSRSRAVFQSFSPRSHQGPRRSMISTAIWSRSGAYCETSPRS